MDSIITPYKQVEQTLRCLTVIAEQTEQGIVVTDLNGVVQFVNTAWAAMHGYENRQTLIGRGIGLFHTKEQMEADIIPFIEEVKRRGRLAGPVDHVRRDRTVFPTEMSMALFRDRMGKALGLLFFAVDITEQQHTKDELSRYRNSLAGLVEQQTGRLKAANEQLQREIAERKHSGQHIRQQIEELKAANKQFRDRIDELSAHGPASKADTLKTTGPFEVVESLTDSERALLVNIFRQNIALQKPEFVKAAIDESLS